MSELSEKENPEDYRKRIRDLVNKMEKDQEKDKHNSIGEQQVIEAKERLLQTAKSKIHPDFRDEKTLMVFTYTIRDYYRRREFQKLTLNTVMKRL